MIAVDIFNRDIVDFRRQLVAALNTETELVNTLNEDHTVTKTIVVNQGADLTALQTEVDAVEVEVDTLQAHEANWVNRDGTVPLTANWDAGSFKISAQTFESDVATGTSPLTVDSETVVTHLNADTVDGSHASEFATSGHTHADYLKKDGTVALTADWSIGAGNAIVGDYLLARSGNVIKLADNSATYGVTVGSTSVLIGGSTHYAEFESDGTLKFTGDSCVFDMLQLPVVPLSVPDGSEPDIDTAECAYLFPKNDANEYAMLLVSIPPDYREGSTIYPVVKWLQTSSGQATFKLSYDWINKGTASDKTGTLSMATNLHTYSSGSILQETWNSSGITATSPSNRTIRSLLRLMLYREDNVYTGDATVYELSIIYQKDTVGSRTNTTK